MNHKEEKRHMKKTIFLMIVSALVSSGLFYACNNSEIKTENKPAAPKQMTEAEKKAALEERKKWEATPEGKRFKDWEASPAGKKVHASHDKIKKYIKDYSEMEAIVTSVTFQRENAPANGPKWLIVKILGEKYMMQFSKKGFDSVRDGQPSISTLKVNDKIFLRSRSAGYSHNHPYLIISGDSIAHDNKVLFKREYNKNGC
jgi:hypothetical protein